MIATNLLQIKAQKRVQYTLAQCLELEIHLPNLHTRGKVEIALCIMYEILCLAYCKGTDVKTTLSEQISSERNPAVGGTAVKSFFFFTGNFIIGDYMMCHQLVVRLRFVQFWNIQKPHAERGSGFFFPVGLMKD